MTLRWVVTHHRYQIKLTETGMGEDANAIPSKLQKAITNINDTICSLFFVNGITNTGKLWERINEATGKPQAIYYY
jgi:hypothetical protein